MEELKAKVVEEVTQMFEGVLDFAQVACPESQYKPLRSKILRLGNDCIRNIHRWIDETNGT